MQPTYPRRKRALVYVGILVILLCLTITLSVAGNSYPKSSAMNNKLLDIAALFILLLVIFFIPFVTFAMKYWKLKWEGSPSSPADATVHSLPVWWHTSLIDLIGKPGTLSWNNSDKSIKLTSGPTEQENTVFDMPFGSIQSFDVSVGTIRVSVNDKKYICAPRTGVNVAGMVGGSRGVGALAGLAIAARLVQSAGIPELVERLRAEGVKVAYDQIKISKGLELSFDWAFTILLLGVLYLGVFVFH